MSEHAHAIEFVMPPTISRFVATHGKSKYLQGPFGSSKTVSALMERVTVGIEFYANYPHLTRRTLVVRNTRNELRDTTHRSFMEWFGNQGEWLETKNRFTFYVTGHEFLFYGLDRPQDVRKVLSLEITDFVIDEASQIEHEIFLGLMGRVGRYPKMKGKATADIDLDPCGINVSNPPEDDSWLVEEYETDPKEGYYAFYQPPGIVDTGVDIVTNPKAENTENLPFNYYVDLYNQYAARPDLQQRYVMGKRAVLVRGKAVYGGEFDKSWHITTQKPVVPDGCKVVAGWDNSGNVPACVVGFRNPNGRLDIVQEFTTDRSGIVEFGQAVTRWRNVEYPGHETVDVSDPAGHAQFSSPDGGLTSNAQLMLEKCGVSLLKGVQAFQIRREAVSELLRTRLDGGPALRIYAPGCPRLIAALEGGYCYTKLPDNRGYSPDPQKNRYAHVAEALQYLCSWVGGGVEDDEPLEYREPSIQGWMN